MDPAADRRLHLAAELVDPVCIDRARRGSLGYRDLAGIAVDRGGGCINDRNNAPDTALGLAGFIENDDCAAQVYGMAAQPVFAAVFDRGYRCEIKTAVDTFERIADRLLPRYIGSYQLAAGRDVLRPPAEEIIQHSDRVAVGDQRLGKMRADKAGSPSDQISGHRSSLPGRVAEARRWFMSEGIVARVPFLPGHTAPLNATDPFKAEAMAHWTAAANAA